MAKNKLTKYSELDLVSEHIHIDNGGTTFSLVEYDPDSDEGPHQIAVVISDSYYGYSENKMTLYSISDNPDNLRKIAEFFTLAAIALEKKRVEDKLNY